MQAFAAAGEVSAVDSLRAMARTANGAARELVEMKAVDGAYPLAGDMQLTPAGPLQPALAQHDGVWGAVADAEVLDRLGVKLGDRITVGKLTYELRAVIAREPDRGAGAFLLGPRLMVAQASLAETGLIQPGSLIYRLYRIAYRPAWTTRPSAPSSTAASPMPAGGCAGWTMPRRGSSASSTARPCS